VRALFRIHEWARPVQVVPELRQYFERLQRAQVLKGDGSPDAMEQLARENLLANALLTNTVSTTTAHSGIKHNVIPAIAEATIDCRLLPGTNHEAFTQEVRDVVDDKKVRIEPIFSSDTPPSSTDTELFALIENVVHDHMEEALVLPSLSAGFTDSRVFRRRGVESYGFIPILLEQNEAATIHGHNERITVENLRLGTQILFETVRRLCI
jgi:acetylornithine deacetylase/succinyl-diaminopimelate desuccinylase-like protein